MLSSSFFTSLIRLPKVAFFLGIMIAIWGLVSYFSIPKENAPYIAYGIVNISTPYAGVAAADMKDLVTEKIETKIKNITGITSYSSVSSNGLSTITVEFEPDTDMVKAVSDIRSKVAEAKSFLPTDLEQDPIITEIDSTLTPYMTVVLSGKFSPLELYTFAKDLEKSVEKVSGVSKIDITGGAERQIVVRLDKNKMESLGVGIDEIITVLRNTNKDVPIGDFDIADKTYVVRFEGKFVDTTDIENVVVKTLSNQTNENQLSVISLKDIAKVQEEGKDDAIITRFAVQKSSPENAIFLNISRSTSGDIFSVDAATRKKIEEYAAKNFPSDLHVSYANEVLPNIQQSFSEVFQVGYEAIIIVMLIIFLFVGVLEGIISALIIPITVLFTIGILNIMGASLNFMTNFSMILALGILVDNAIVIVQGIYSNIKQGMDAVSAAQKSVEDFKGPLIAGTLTTLAVFLPLLSLPGVLGQYLSFIPITVSIALASSLFIALFLISSYSATLVPLFSSSQKKTGFIAQKLKDFRNAIDYFIDHIYGVFLNTILPSRTIRLSLLLGSIFLLYLSSFFPISSEQFPAGDSDRLSVIIEKPVGTIQESVLSSVQDIERLLVSFPETKHITTTIHNEKATIDIELLPKDTREDLGLRTSMEIETEINMVLPRIPNAQAQLSSEQKGPPSDSPVAFRVIAEDRKYMEAAKKVTMDLTTIMNQMDGATGVKHNIKEIPGEFRFSVDREKAMKLGVMPDTIAMTMRSIVNGTTATTVTRSGQDIDVIVRYDTEAIDSLDDFKNIMIRSVSGSQIPLSELVIQTQFNGVQSVFTEDGDTAFTISAFLGLKSNGDEGNADDITKQFKEHLGEYSLPEGVQVIDAGESASNAELNNSLAVGGVAAILLMYFIVFFQFQSFLQPIIILQTILFAQIGVNLGLFLFDIPKSLAYTLGLITLFGIIVNHAIILIDQINKNRNAFGKIISYEEVISVVVEGCKSRFHPVIMTGIATIAGLVPLLSVDEFWYGLASTIIFGLITATVLIFFVTPATYIQLEKEKWRTFGLVGVLISFLIVVNIGIGML